MKVYIIQSKNGIMINVDMCVKNSMSVTLVKMIICGIRARVIGNVIKHVKLTSI